MLRFPVQLACLGLHCVTTTSFGPEDHTEKTISQKATLSEARWFCQLQGRCRDQYQKGCVSTSKRRGWKQNGSLCFRMTHERPSIFHVCLSSVSRVSYEVRRQRQFTKSTSGTRPAGLIGCVTPEPAFYGLLALGMSGLFVNWARWSSNTCGPYFCLA